MADPASHTLTGGIIVVVLGKILALPFLLLAAVIAVASFLSHFVLDAVPHGHLKETENEIFIGFVVIAWVLATVYCMGGAPLFWLTFIAVFFANVFDVIVSVAKRLPTSPRTLWIAHLAYAVHRFEHNRTWKFGWYNVAMWIFLVFIFSLCLCVL